MSLTLAPIGLCAAEITNLDCAQISEEMAKDVRQAFQTYPVLVFRDQTLTAPQLAAFGRIFGTLESYADAPAKPVTAAVRESKGRATPDQMLYISPDDPDVLVMTNEIRADAAPISIVDNAEVWHADGSHKTEPYKAVITHVVRNPAHGGGETEFCDMRALYDAMPAKLQAQMQTLRGIHHWSKSRNPRFAASLDAEAMAAGERIAAMIPDMPQPLVAADAEIGRPFLYMSPRFTVRIDGVPADLSRALMDNIFGLMDDPGFIYRHTWRDNDLLIWDNRCLNHRVRAYAEDDIRTRHRVTVSGDGPMVGFRGIKN